MEIKTYISSEPIPEYDYTVNFEDNNCTIIFAPEQLYTPFFSLTGAYAESILFTPDYYDMGDNTYFIDNISIPNQVLQISAKNTDGVSSLPSFHMKQDSSLKNISGSFKILQYEYGIIVSFVEEEFSGMNAFLSFKRNGVQDSYPLTRKSKLSLVSHLLSPAEFLDVNEIKVYYKSQTPLEIFSMDFSGSVINPDSSFQIQFFDNRLQISGMNKSFYDSVLVWANPTEAPFPKEGEIIAGPYLIEPSLIPYNKDIQLKFNLDRTQIMQQYSIYYYNKKSEHWSYLPSNISENSSYIETTILSGEIFAVIRESNPPVITDLTPDINGTYYSNDLEHISFFVRDGFSGLEGETDIILKLDDTSVVFEYNSYQKKVRYPLKYNLKKGVHTLYVQASDKVGNQTNIEGVFHVK